MKEKKRKREGCGVTVGSQLVEVGGLFQGFGTLELLGILGKQLNV